MFQRLYELSMILPQKATWEKLNEGMPPKSVGLALCFDEQGCWFAVQTFLKKETDWNFDVIHRQGSPNGKDLTPCRRFYQSSGTKKEDKHKSVARLAQKGKEVDSLAKSAFVSGDEKDWLLKTLQSFKDNEDEICNAVDKAASSLKEQKSTIFIYWAKKKSDDEIEPIYSWESSKRFLEQQFFDSLYKDSKGKERGGKRSQGVCMISGKVSAEVYGGFSEIACYNLDKPGSIAGGFVENLAHRNFPISKEVAVDIAYAFTYANDYLQGMMAGETYLILPYAVNPKIREQLHNLCSKHPDRFQLGKDTDLLAARELKLVKEFENSGDQIAFFLVFYEKIKASWKIQAEIQELLPSRLKILRDERRKIERAPDLISVKEGEEKPLTISANTFKYFTSGTKEQSASILRAWLVALFEGKTIDYHHFLHHLVDKIIVTGKENPEYLHNTTREALGLYRYALLTGFIKRKETTMGLLNFDSVYGLYIHEHSDFFTQPEIITAFLSGCYVSIVTNVQYHERKATPFTKKFIGRLLNKGLLKRLYREAHDKLMQYESLGIVAKRLDPDLTQSWVACGQSWNISNEETTFAFTIGYSLQSRISQLYKEPMTKLVISQQVTEIVYRTDQPYKESATDTTEE